MGSALMPGGVSPAFAAPMNVRGSVEGGPNAEPLSAEPTISYFLRSAASGAPRPTLLKPGFATCCAPADAAANDNATAATARQTPFCIPPTYPPRRTHRAPDDIVANATELVSFVAAPDRVANGGGAPERAKVRSGARGWR